MQSEVEAGELNSESSQDHELLSENENSWEIPLEEIMILKMDDVLRKLAKSASHRTYKIIVYIPAEQLKAVVIQTTSEMISGTFELVIDSLG